MIPSPEYNMAAYMLAIAQQVERDISDVYIDGDNPAKQMLLSERVIYADREVTQAAFHKFLGVLRQLQQQSQRQMEEFEVRRRKPSEYAIRLDEACDTGEDKDDDADGEQEGEAQEPQTSAGPEPPRAPGASSRRKDPKPGGGGGS